MTGALFFDEKIRQSAALFGLECGMLESARILQIFYSRAVVHRTIVDSPAFLETSLAENIAVCVHLSRLPKK
jgi:hypothetical protein